MSVVPPMVQPGGTVNSGPDNPYVSPSSPSSAGSIVGSEPPGATGSIDKSGLNFGTSTAAMFVVSVASLALSDTEVAPLVAAVLAAAVVFNGLQILGGKRSSSSLPASPVTPQPTTPGQPGGGGYVPGQPGGVLPGTQIGNENNPLAWLWNKVFG